MSRFSELRNHDLFAPFDDDEFATLERVMVERIYRPGHVLIREGDSAASMSSAMYVVVDGEVEVFSKRPEGGFGVSKTVGSGAILGLVGLVDDKPRSATCRAAGRVTAVHLTRAAFAEMYRSKIELAAKFQFAVARQLATDIRSLDHMLRDAVIHGNEAAIRDRFDRGEA